MLAVADSEAFEQACALLEELTEFSRLEARGTIRIALKHAGFKPASVLASELRVVVQAVLPAELGLRGVSESESVCMRLGEKLARTRDAPEGESPESVFSRLAGRE